MQLVQKNTWNQSSSFAVVKSFLIWSFTLAVCLLVVGFPLIVLMVTGGVLLTIILQSVLPMSAVLLVAGTIVGGNVLAIIIGAAILTFRGINPQEVRWLSWLHGEASPSHGSVYASCPLTCELSVITSR
jgi:nitrate reductase gamma subunit